MTIKVCDAICGAGKTQACINMMNHTDEKFIFVTQYLTEVDRIKRSCAEKNFVSPEASFRSGFSKLSDIHYLMKKGMNIASTQALFGYYTEETKQLIRDQGYILILDEVIDVLCETTLVTEDINILKKSKTIQEDNETIEWIDDEYENADGIFYDVMRQAKSKNLINYGGKYAFWCIPPDVFSCFKEVYVLSYMFEYQPLRCFFDMQGFQYEMIGTVKIENEYQFCELDKMSRKIDLRHKIHILENAKMNSIGSRSTSLSFSWYGKMMEKRGTPELLQIKNNLMNVFRNIYKAKSSDILWTTYKNCLPYLGGKGYTKGFVTYNKKACNDYSNRKYLAYCVNLYPRPWELNYYSQHGVLLNKNMYALSLLIQWIFRSAIRKGDEIWIYIPSWRMRTLLKQWLDNLSTGNDLQQIKFEDDDKRKKIFTDFNDTKEGGHSSEKQT